MSLGNRRLHLIAVPPLVVAAVLLLLAACGGGNDEEVTKTPARTTAPAATETPGGGAGGEVTFEITMGDNFFELDGEKNPTLAVPAGSKVTIDLTNKGTAIHNMRFSGGDNQYNTGDDAVSDPALVTAGQKATLKFTAPTKAGKYIYQCDFHPTDMKGEIEVQ